MSKGDTAPAEVRSRIIELIKDDRTISTPTAVRRWIKFIPTQVPDVDASRRQRQPKRFHKRGAWNFIRAKLEEGWSLEEVELEKPGWEARARPYVGWVMKIPLDLRGTRWIGHKMKIVTKVRALREIEPLYVKLEIFEADVYGRSFHLDDEI